MIEAPVEGGPAASPDPSALHPRPLRERPLGREDGYDPPPRWPRRRLVLDVLIVLLMVVFAFFLRQWRLGLPETRYFDEIYYAKAGGEDLAGQADSNTVHPPLGKMLIAVCGGMYNAIAVPLQRAGWVGGVTDFTEWRVGSLLFGLLTIPLTYALGLRMFRSRSVAVMATFLLCIDFLHLVQSRITMLDMYLTFFVLAGTYAAWRYIEAQRDPTGWAVLSVLCFSVGFACKWNSLFAGLGAVIAMLGLKPFPLERSDASDRRVMVGFGLMVALLAGLIVHYRFGIRIRWAVLGLFLGFLGVLYRIGWPRLRGAWTELPRLALLYFFMVPIIYLIAFLPFIWQHNWSLSASWDAAKANHLEMIHFREGKEFKHRYMSQYWAWPTMLRPVWYHYEDHADREGSLFPPNKDTRLMRLVWGDEPTDSYVTGILAMGSPFVWWTFLVFLALSLVQSLIIPLIGCAGVYFRRRDVSDETPPFEPDGRGAPEELPVDEWADYEIVERPAWRRCVDGWRFGQERPWLFLMLLYFPQVLLWAFNRGFLFYMLPCVPFMCIFVAGILREWFELPMGRLCAGLYLLIATLCLVAYYPLLTAWSIPKPIYEELVMKRWI